MYRFALKTMLVLFAIMICISCDKKGHEGEIVNVDEISFENYPKVDGSTSANVLNTMIACKLLGVRYEWIRPSNIISNEWTLKPNSEDIPKEYAQFFNERVITSQTHGAFINLIDGTADIIITHRTISLDEKV